MRALACPRPSWQAAATDAIATGNELLAVSRQLGPKAQALQALAEQLSQIRDSLPAQVALPVGQPPGSQPPEGGTG
jgi:hypothetical protein